MSIPKKSKQAATQKPAKKTAPKKTAKPKAAKKVATKKVAAKTGGGTKRSAEELTALKANIERTVTLTTGLTAEEIAKSLGTTTKALAMPLRQLRAAKTLSTSGTRRFLRYFPKGQAPKGKAAQAKGGKG